MVRSFWYLSGVSFAHSQLKTVVPCPRKSHDRGDLTSHRLIPSCAVAELESLPSVDSNRGSGTRVIPAASLSVVTPSPSIAATSVTAAVTTTSPGITGTSVGASITSTSIVIGIEVRISLKLEVGAGLAFRDILLQEIGDFLVSLQQSAGENAAKWFISLRKERCGYTSMPDTTSSTCSC
jgi:hypothetical protein